MSSHSSHQIMWFLKESTTNLATPLARFVPWGLLSFMYREQASLVSACPIVAKTRRCRVTQCSKGSAPIEMAAPVNCKSTSYTHCCEYSVPCDCSQETTATGQCSPTSYAFGCGVGTPCSEPPINISTAYVIVVLQRQTPPIQTVQKTVEVLQTHFLDRVLDVPVRTTARARLLLVLSYGF